MMIKQTIQPGAGLNVTGVTRLALAASAALGLAACQDHAYPSAAPREATNAPASADATLAGAPNTRMPEYVPPGSPPPTGYGPRAYPPGAASAPEIVTMAPIPNPPETPAHHGRRRHHYVYGAAGHGYVFHPYSHHAMGHHPAPHHRVVHQQMQAAPTAPPAQAPAQLTKPTAPAHGRHSHPAADAATAAAAAGGPVAANSTGNTTTDSEADSYQALQQSLHTLFNNEAKLDVPGHIDASQPATVTLTFPADFAGAAQAEASKDGLSQAVSSINLIASLTGDGYTITPIDVQSLPLTLSTPTVFQWRVTPTGAARTALKVSAKAQGIGDSHVLDLGDKTNAQDSGGFGKLIGLGLLAIVVVSFLGWLATRKPAKKPVKRPPPMQFDPPRT